MSRPAEQPTARQLRLLRSLAERTGTTFTNPSTRPEASAEIRRLKALPAMTGGERTYEECAHEGDRAVGTPASSVRPEEVTGYGSSATWAERA